jgi:hypothetical protein
LLAGPAGGRMRARAPPRPSPHAPAPATGGGDPRRGPSLFSFLAQDARSEPSTPRRGSPVRSPRAQEPMATRGTGGSTTPPPISWRSCWRTKGLTQPKANSRVSAWREGGWPRPPSGPRPMAPERAGSPAGVPRWGVDAPARSEGDSEGPRRGTPCSVARAGGSEGGAGAPPERHGRSPRAKEWASRSEGRERPTRGTGRTRQRPPLRRVAAAGCGSLIRHLEWERRRRR